MALPNTPISYGLIAIALVIRSRDGPRFVFHYPAQPSAEVSRVELYYGTDLDPTRRQDLDLGGDSEDSDFEDRAYHNPFSKLSLNQQDGDNTHVDLSRDEHYDTPSGTHVVPWEHLFEYPTTDLESILTPSRAYHKRKFELTLDPLYFLSYPFHIRNDGLWKRKKPKKSKRARKDEPESRAPDSNTAATDDDDDDDEYRENKPNKPKVENESEDCDEGGITMFNAVFILDVSKHDAADRLEIMYEHFVKRFNKALYEVQAHSNYVWKECEMILAMKDKAREERRPMSWLWNEIILTSTLAATMQEIFNAVSSNRAANFQLGAKFDLYLRIHVPSFLTSLPSYEDRAMPGLLITSASPLVQEDDDIHLNKHFALLLLDNEADIISDLQAENTELSAALVECIRLCKPTVSFFQTAQTNSVELASLLTLASHLIVYHRAIAIPPLHSRKTYIVSPNCDSRKIPEASVAWKKAFPLAPPLPNFLASLSAAPRPYKTFSPSKDHRHTYLEMLAWLIRGSWVTQLRTFAWIHVWPEIQYEVDYLLRAEAIDKAKKGSNQKSPRDSSTESADESGPYKPEARSYIPLTTEQVAEKARLERLADKVAKQAADEAMAFTQLPVPVATDHPSTNKAEHLQAFPAPYIIKDPHKVSYEESLYIAAIEKRIANPKAKEFWSRLTKYFNGSETLESIALRENMKRKETWHILMAYQEHILVCKHW